MCAHSGLEGCASAREATSISSLRNAARTPVSKTGYLGELCLGARLQRASVSDWSWTRLKERCIHEHKSMGLVLL